MTILDVGVGTFTVSFFAGLFVLAFILGRIARTNAPPLLALLLLGVVILILATLQPTAPSSTVVVTTVVRRGRRARARARRATRKSHLARPLPYHPQVYSNYWSILPAFFVVVAFFALVACKNVLITELESPRTAKLIPG